jgi:hypothetical protein
MRLSREEEGHPIEDSAMTRIQITDDAYAAQCDGVPRTGDCRFTGARQAVLCVAASSGRQARV